MTLLNRPSDTDQSSGNPVDKGKKVLGFIPKRMIEESAVITVAMTALLLDSKLMSRISARSRAE